MPKKRITVKEVAKAAGVSTQTVSRVVNNHPDVAPATSARVQQVIRRMGYAPNVLARSLIRGRTYTLGVVTYGIDYFGPARLLTGIDQQAAELGYSIVLHLVHDPEPDDAAALLNSLNARQVDGLIWAVPEIGSNRAWASAQAARLPVPAIFINGMEQPGALPLVGVDNQAIGRLATEHLLAGGALRVGHLAGPEAWWAARERRRGWEAALQAHGLEPQRAWLAGGDWTVQSGEQGLYALLGQCPDVTAVFAANDQMALGALHAAHRLGRRVPDDLAIVGVDNQPEAAHFWPPLTSVRQHLLEAGALAVQQLTTLIAAAQPPGNGQSLVVPVTWLQPELVVRESSRRMSGRHRHDGSA
jgi:LacI family transcriptional regulator